MRRRRVRQPLVASRQGQPAYSRGKRTKAVLEAAAVSNFCDTLPPHLAKAILQQLLPTCTDVNTDGDSQEEGVDSRRGAALLAWLHSSDARSSPTRVVPLLCSSLATTNTDVVLLLTEKGGRTSTRLRTMVPLLYTDSLREQTHRRRPRSRCQPARLQAAESDLRRLQEKPRQGRLDPPSVRRRRRDFTRLVLATGSQVLAKNHSR